jgi:peptidoglycan/LPS O-acetylase OafA/YrhL
LLPSSTAGEDSAVTAPGRQSTGFRPDLEGLRGVAILLVLAFHAGIPGFAGGFVGVDVFFVLSGFLITGLLLRERLETGGVDLRAFYARRARRILPAAAVVLVLTLIAAAFLAPPLDLPRFASDAAASALSVGNIRFASQSVGYFSASESPSPFLHYWSLGVEEQFYLIWPALLILAARWGRPAAAIAAALVIVFATSLLAAVVLTDVSAPWAFYSLPTRAWQLALGGLLAAVPLLAGSRAPSPLLAGIGWLGLLAVVAAGSVLISPDTPYPGIAAILPTVGTAALILSGTRPGSPGAILAAWPLRFLGRISFSLYLIHWPILILPAAGLALGAELPILERLLLCVAAIALAWLSWRLVEEPFHRGRMFSGRPNRVLALGMGSIVATTVFAVIVGLTATRLLDAPVQAGTGVLTPSHAPATNPGTVPVGQDRGPDGTPPPGVETVGPEDPDETEQPGATPAPGETFVPGEPTPVRTPKPPKVPFPVPGSGALAANIKPALSAASDDWERLYKEGCELEYAGTTPPNGCKYGDPDGDFTVALVGDSMAGQWFPAIERLASERHWRVHVFIKFACRFEDIRQYSRVIKREYWECNQWIPNVVDRLMQIKPDLTLVSADRSPGVLDPADDNPVRQGQAMARLLQDVPGKIGIIVSTPQLPWDVPACLSAHKSDVTACEADKSDAFGWRRLIAERAAVKDLGERATVIDLSKWLCPGSTCPSVLDNFIAWRDYFHLTATFAANLAPAFAAQLPQLDDGYVAPTPGG